MQCPLTEKKCLPCSGYIPPLDPENLARLAVQLPDWTVVRSHHLERVFPAQDFAQALSFAVRAGEVAEAENHHPELVIAWGRLEVRIWTHKIDGLTESDFILAAKIEQAIGLQDTPL